MYKIAAAVAAHRLAIVLSHRYAAAPDSAIASHMEIPSSRLSRLALTGSLKSGRSRAGAKYGRGA